MELREHQLEVIDQLGSGKILYGGVGSGKSVAVLGYYMKCEQPKDIYVITTAKKRDSLDWQGEAAKFGIGTERSGSIAGTLTVDSWNNCHRYTEVRDGFFVFDEQRVVGSGTWVRSFLKIARHNNWILLSATPGDTWLDYAPVFIANGFYKNITQFKLEHVVYEPFNKYPKVRGYLNVTKLELLRNEILVEMQYSSESKRAVNWIPVGHDKDLFERVFKDRWNIYEDRPIKDVSEMFRLMRRVVNSDISRLETLRWIMGFHPRLIVFYNFNYELEILRTLEEFVEIGELNGHRHDSVPNSANWVYLVQYVAGAEAWNCTDTDATVFWSLTYSFKNFMQAMGRIDRMDTVFEVLYYYVFVSNSFIDRAIKGSLDNKKSFNERKFMRESGVFGNAEDKVVGV